MLRIASTARSASRLIAALTALTVVQAVAIDPAQSAPLPNLHSDSYDLTVRYCLDRYQGAGTEVVRRDDYDDNPKSPLYKPGRPLYVRKNSPNPQSRALFAAPPPPAGAVYLCLAEVNYYIDRDTVAAVAAVATPSPPAVSKTNPNPDSPDATRAYCNSKYQGSAAEVVRRDNMDMNSNSLLYKAGQGVYVRQNSADPQSRALFSLGGGSGIYMCVAEVPSNFVNRDQIAGTAMARPPANPLDTARKACGSDTLVWVLDQTSRDSAQMYGKRMTIFAREGELGWLSKDVPANRFGCLSSSPYAVRSETYPPGDYAALQAARATVLARDHRDPQTATPVVESTAGAAQAKCTELYGSRARADNGRRRDEVVRRDDVYSQRNMGTLHHGLYLTSAAAEFLDTSANPPIGSYVCRFEADALKLTSSDGMRQREALAAKAVPVVPASALRTHDCSPTSHGAVPDTILGKIAFVGTNDVWFCGPKQVYYATNNAGNVVGIVMGSLGMFPLVASGGGNLVAQGGGNLVATGGGNIVLRSPSGERIIEAGDAASLISNKGGGVMGNSGGTILTHAGANLINDGGAYLKSGLPALVASGGGNVIGDKGSGVISDWGAGVVNKNGSGVLSTNGSTIATNAGANIAVNNGANIAVNNGANLAGGGALARTTAASFANNPAAGVISGYNPPNRYQVTANTNNTPVVLYSARSSADALAAFRACSGSNATSTSGLNTVIVTPKGGAWLPIPSDPAALKSLIQQGRAGAFACENGPAGVRANNWPKASS